MIDAMACPQFEFLLDSEKVHPGLQPVAFFDKPLSVLHKVMK